MPYEQGESLLQGVEAAHANNSINHVVLYQFDDLRKPFRYDTQAAQLLGLVLQAGDVAAAAAVAEQPVGIELGLTLAVLAQALGQHQQASLMGNARHNREPQLVVDLDHKPGMEMPGRSLCLRLGNEFISQLLQLLERDRRAKVLRLHKLFQFLAQCCPLFQRWRYS